MRFYNNTTEGETDRAKNHTFSFFIIIITVIIFIFSCSRFKFRFISLKRIFYFYFLFLFLEIGIAKEAGDHAFAVGVLRLEICFFDFYCKLWLGAFFFFLP